jgi:uncharacterized protein YjbI with pentapeptide repeats
VAPAFSVSADFAIDKPAGQPCPHLRGDFRCDIHAHLRQRGFPGCAAYDCLGAGQRVSQVTFGGRDWRQAPGTARRMFAAFSVVRRLHDLLWHLTAALALAPARPLHADLRAALAETERLAGLGPDELLALDVAARERDAGALLRRASELARAASGRRSIDRAGADLAGADLRRADLRAADLRGALLVGADLRAADLRLADLLGADLRGADLRRADLRGALFLTPPQLAGARGDAGTRLAPALDRPPHWRAG